MQSLETALQKQVANTSRRNASWGQKELALSADHVSLSALNLNGQPCSTLKGTQVLTQPCQSHVVLFTALQYLFNRLLTYCNVPAMAFCSIYVASTHGAQAP